ncbi:MAG: hypothetical protein KQI81_19710 [Deltaproteobacteria bacterium]|nr:hypothetical protein [Deltaproteobacteria bacterium]
MERSLRNSLRMGFFLILAGAVIYACGGAGTIDLASSGGGTGGTGISVGSVSGFGSIYVNGVRYDTSNAEIYVEGRSTGFGDATVLAQLAVGMVVRVEGDIEDSLNGTAHKVYFNDDLRGPIKAGSIQEIDSVTTELIVLGKTVIIQDITKLKDIDLDSLAGGVWIQVSGFEDAEGRIHASFVTESTSSAKANLKGTISAVDSFNRIITINGIDISYQSADLIGMNQLSTGQLVEVTGDIPPAGPLAMTADTIETVDFLGTDDADMIELQGIVSLENSQILLNGVPIIMDAQTVYNGGDASDIASDVWVEVEGQLIDGTLYAERVIFLTFAKVEADVEAKHTGQSVIILRGLTDIPIRYNEITKVTGAVTSTDDIDVTHHVKIIGLKLPPSEPETMLAVHIITKSTLDEKVILQGALESDPPLIKTDITLLDHVIDISGIPDGSFESPGGIGYTAFSTSTEAGDIVSAKGTRIGNTVQWQSISVE